MTHQVVRILEFLRQKTRRSVPRSVYIALAQCVDGWYAMRYVGLRRYLDLNRSTSTLVASSDECVGVSVAGIEHPVFVRPGATDLTEVIHSCARQAYGKFLPGGDVRLIIDAGANIGDTTVWYLNRFPDATVIAIEPDPDNFLILQKNCAPYGVRAIPIRAALWPKDGDILQIVSSSMASGKSVTAGTANGSSECSTVSMTHLMQMTPLRSVDIFKCDIEGAELQLFTDSADRWLPSVRSIAIEIHSKECHLAVASATSRFGFSLTRYRDIYVFQR